MLPRTCLKHRQNENILAGVMREGIKHPRPLDPCSCRRPVLAAQIFADGNHT